MLHVLDLQTSFGFELSDGTKQRCVVGTGPIIFRVGRYAIVALPNGTELAESIPEPVVDCADANPYTVKAERVEVREGSGVFLYDTGSSNGTAFAGSRVRCVALSDSGTEVVLARVDGGVRLHWRGLGGPSA